tara:strand:+ start:973 stop:1323 length:351 start_codon:yes stop_codon:yes gene_type:complete
MVEQIMNDKTKEFLNNIDIQSKSEELKDTDFYTINLCQKLIDLYLLKNNNSIKKTFEFFCEIFNNNNLGASTIRIISGLCIDVLRLRLAKTLDDEKLKNESLENIKKFVNILDCVI